MRANWLRKFATDERASVTVEFVALLFFFLVLTLMVIEIALAVFWWQTAKVAAQMGARYAIVSDFAVTSLSSSSVNGLNTGGTFGASCNISSSSDPCTGFTTASCAGGTGGVCSSTAFNAILTKMRTVFAALQASNVTVTYQYAGLGFVGGRIVPAVTVTITNVPFVTGFGDVLSPFFGASALNRVPTTSATYTGEDLSNAGV